MQPMAVNWLAVMNCKICTCVFAVEQNVPYSLVVEIHVIYASMCRPAVPSEVLKLLADDVDLVVVLESPVSVQCTLTLTLGSL